MILAIPMNGKIHVLQDILLPMKHAFMSSCRDMSSQHEGHVLRTCLVTFFWRLWKTCLTKTLATKSICVWHTFWLFTAQLMSTNHHRISLLSVCFDLSRAPSSSPLHGPLRFPRDFGLIPGRLNKVSICVQRKF